MASVVTMSLDTFNNVMKRLTILQGEIASLRDTLDNESTSGSVYFEGESRPEKDSPKLNIQAVGITQPTDKW